MLAFMMWPLWVHVGVELWLASLTLPYDLALTEARRADEDPLHP